MLCEYRRLEICKMAGGAAKFLRKIPAHATINKIYWFHPSDRCRCRALFYRHKLRDIYVARYVLRYKIFRIIIENHYAERNYCIYSLLNVKLFILHDNVQ